MFMQFYNPYLCVQLVLRSVKGLFFAFICPTTSFFGRNLALTTGFYMLFLIIYFAAHVQASIAILQEYSQTNCNQDFIIFSKQVLIPKFI